MSDYAAKIPGPEAAAKEAGSLLDQIMAKTNIAPEDEGYDTARKGVEVFIAEILKGEGSSDPINKARVDRMITALDRKISAQMDEILHHEDFQVLEATWRGLKLLVDRTDFRENVRIELVSVRKDELLEDFELSSEVSQSGLYKHVYAAGYGQFGGQPVGAIVGLFEFSHAAPDVKLLQYCAAVGAMAHAPFLSSAAPSMFGISSLTQLPEIKELSAVFEGPQYAKWRALRESEDSRYVGLTTPRFLLRHPYDPIENSVRTFQYREKVSDSHENYLWGNTALLMAERIHDSFAKFRWCPNIIGPQSGGAVEDLPVHVFESLGALENKIPTEVLITDRREFELAEEGFIALTMRKDSDNAVFFSANSIQKPKRFANTEEGKVAETNYKLGTQLPYMFIINRLAHYIKVLQREQIGSWKERGDLERELNGWIMQYVADQENPPADVRSRRPLRAAKIDVSDVAGDPGWYLVSMAVRPHFKYMGANFELSLVGRLDKE